MKIQIDHDYLFSYTPLNVPVNRIGCQDGGCMSFTLNGTAGSGDWGGWKFIGKPDAWQNPASGPYQVQYDGHTFYMKYLGGGVAEAGTNSVDAPASVLVLLASVCLLWLRRRAGR